MKNLKQQVYWQIRDTVIELIARSDCCRFKLDHSDVRDKISMRLLNRVRGQVQEQTGDLRL